MGWEPSEVVVVRVLMLRTEPKLVIRKQGLLGKDFFWSICLPTKNGISAEG